MNYLLGRIAPSEAARRAEVRGRFREPLAATRHMRSIDPSEASSLPGTEPAGAERGCPELRGRRADRCLPHEPQLFPPYQGNG